MEKGDSLEWHESLDLQLVRFNNIKISKKLIIKELLLNVFIYGKSCRKKNIKVRKEYEKEGYSEIAENSMKLRLDNCNK